MLDWSGFFLYHKYVNRDKLWWEPAIHDTKSVKVEPCGLGLSLIRRWDEIWLKAGIFIGANRVVTSDVDTKTSKKVSCSWRAALMVALFLGLLVSLSDALVITLYEAPRAAMFLRVLEPLAVKIIMIVLLYGVLWFLLLYPLSRVLKLNAEALSVSLGVFIALAYVLSVHNTLAWGSLVQNVRMLVLIGGGFLMALVFSWAAYSATKAISKSKWRVLVVAVCLTVPLLLAETVVALWVNKCLLEPLPARLALLWGKVFTLPVLATNIVYLAGIVVTLALFLCLRRGRAPLKVLQVFAVLIFAGSVLALIFGSGQAMASKANVRTTQPVKRVILIVSDTLRSDALSCYGGQRIETPHIDQFTADGIFFEKAFAPAPWTTPSVASMITGLSPLVHMTTDYKSVLPDALRTLAEYMRDAGYLTQAIGSNPMLARRNFWQGFMGYNFFPKREDLSPCGRVLSWLFPRRFAGTASTSELTRLAIDWLDTNADNDFFLWLYYFDPHAPYEPPAEYLPDKEPAPGMGESFGTVGAHAPVRSGSLKLTGEQREWARTLYDSEVRYVDDNVGLVLDHLKKLNIYDDSLIILTSDHGEEFWEHDSYEHGHTLYNELLSVPLIIKLPAPLLKTTVAQPVSAESVMPTVLQLCGIEYKQDCLSRGSLVPFWSVRSEVNEADPILCTGLLYYEEKEAVIFDGLKYIHSLVTGREEFYDLTDDSGERFNIAHLSAAKLDKASEILTKHYKATGRLKELHSLEKPQEAELDADTRRQLKSLGYVE